MNTQRPREDSIITSGVVSDTNTARHKSDIISSEVDNPNIISASVSGTIQLNNVPYSIIKQIARSGESEVFLVDRAGQKFVFKLYYPQYKPKDEVLIQLKGLSHPDIIAVCDFGYHNGRFYELVEYAEGGTLKDLMPLKDFARIRELVKEIINALNFCHSHGMIHRDIKPENIFFRDSTKTDLAIGDFGIASALDKGFSKRMTNQARTTIFAPPEVFMNTGGKTVLGKEVDYYALGMTLLNLWTGEDPFSDVGEFGVMRIKIEGRLVLPEEMRDELKTLIKGLLTVEISKRWGYNEVQRWLRSEPVGVYFATHIFDYKNYSFGYVDGEDVIVNNPKDLANYLEKYPKQGEGHLYRHTIAKWSESVNPGLYNELMDIVERDCPRDRKAGLTKAVYVLDRDRSFRGFDGTILRTQEEMAQYFEDHFDHYEKDLQNPNASFYLFLDARNYKDKADEYRKYFRDVASEAALNVLILKLQGADKFITGNYTIYQPRELLQVDADTKVRILSQLANPRSKLSLWISSFVELRPTIDEWRLLKRYDETSIRYALLQGYELNGRNVSNVEEFTRLLNDQFGDFFFETNAEHNRYEADYWLRHYQNSSLEQVAIRFLTDYEYSEREFGYALVHVLKDSAKSGKIYQVLADLLKVIKVRTCGNEKMFNLTVEMSGRCVGECLKERESTSQDVLTRLDMFLTFVENNKAEYPEYFVRLTQRLDGLLPTELRRHVDTFKDNERALKDFRSRLEGVAKRFQALNPELTYLKRYAKEIRLINHKKRTLSEANDTELESAMKKLNEVYERIKVEKRASVRASYKTNPRRGRIVGLCFGIYWTLAGLAFLCSGIIFGFKGTLFKDYTELNPFFYGIMQFHNHPINLFYLIMGMIPLYVGGVILGAIYDKAAYYLGRRKAIASVTLAPEELNAKMESITMIYDHFAKKLEVELHNETSRILLMDDDEVNSSLSKNVEAIS